MAIENVQQMIPKIQAFFADQRIKKAWLFGSYSRGEEGPDSDVDILVEYKDSNKISLIAISHMINSLENILNKRVDLVEELLPMVSDKLMSDVVIAYENEHFPIRIVSRI